MIALSRGPKLSLSIVLPPCAAVRSQRQLLGRRIVSLTLSELRHGTIDYRASFRPQLPQRANSADFGAELLCPIFAASQTARGYGGGTARGLRAFAAGAGGHRQVVLYRREAWHGQTMKFANICWPPVIIPLELEDRAGCANAAY